MFLGLREVAAINFATGRRPTRLPPPIRHSTHSNLLHHLFWCTDAPDCSSRSRSFLPFPVQLCSCRLHGAGVIVRVFGALILYLTCFVAEAHFTEERPVVTYGRSCYCWCAVTSDCYLCFPAHSLQGSGVTLSTHFIGPLVDLFRSAYAGDTSSSVLLFLKSCSFLIILHWRITLARRPRGFGSSLGGGGSGGDFEDFLGWLSASCRINGGGGDFQSPPFTSLCD